jgi:hypothetical protein
MDDSARNLPSHQPQSQEQANPADRFKQALRGYGRVDASSQQSADATETPIYQSQPQAPQPNPTFSASVPPAQTVQDIPRPEDPFTPPPPEQLAFSSVQPQQQPVQTERPQQTEQPTAEQPTAEQQQTSPSDQPQSRFANMDPGNVPLEDLPPGYDDYYPDFLPPPPPKEEVIYQWEAPSRPFKPHNRQYYTTVGTIVLLVSLILFFAGQFLPIAVVLAVAFLTYVMSSIPPQEVTNAFTTFGIRIGDQLFFWEEASNFWFKEKFGQEVLHIDVLRFPNRLTLLVGDADKELIRDFLSLTMIEQEPAPTYYERAANWLQKKIPLDIDG